VKDGFRYVFWELCFENRGYIFDDLGAPSIWFRLGRVTPLDGAAIRRRGKSMRGKLPNWKCFTLCFESREKSYPLDGAAPMERSPLRGEAYQRDGASSDSPILIFSLKLDFFFIYFLWSWLFWVHFIKSDFYILFGIDYFDSFSFCVIFIYFFKVVDLGSFFLRLCDFDIVLFGLIKLQSFSNFHGILDCEFIIFLYGY